MMETPYKTPLKKLTVFFLSSRDKWKKRAQKAHYEVKLKRNRIKFLEESKEKLKQENLILKKHIFELESSKAVKNQVILKKNCLLKTIDSFHITLHKKTR